MPYRFNTREVLKLNEGQREASAVQNLGSTGGPITPDGVTVITATAANLVYTLPPPQAGIRKSIYIGYTGNADDLIVACETTAQFFNGSTANTIVVSSSMTNIAIKLYGLSTTNWAALASGPSISTSLIYSASTISSSTDRLT